MPSLALDDLALMMFIAPQMFHLEYSAGVQNQPPSPNTRQIMLPSQISTSAKSKDWVIRVIDQRKGTERKASMKTLERFYSGKKRKGGALQNIVKLRTDTFNDYLDNFVESNPDVKSLNDLYRRASELLPSNHAEDISDEELLNEYYDLSDGFINLIPSSNKPNVVFTREIDAKEACFRSSNINQILESMKILPDKLYSHQVEAIEALREGNHVVVSTPTSSGKSLIYNIPVIEGLGISPNNVALYIFPTKALAQDQTLKLRTILKSCGMNDIHVNTFDGDTEQDCRSSIRDNTHIIVSNPDMIHAAILPHHYKWRIFLRNLKYIIVDELHIYSGQFGTHVALVMRRLNRILSKYGNFQVQYISCSATIGNPGDHFSNLIGISSNCIKVIDKSGAPEGLKEFVVWKSDNLINDAVFILYMLVKHRIRSIVFCKYRKICEYVFRQFCDSHPDNAHLIHSYRGGYTAEKRRQLEAKLFDGSLLGVISTNALELGIDIGDIDATLHLGFPMSLASLKQQAGRAGRRSKRSLAVYIADLNDPIDCFYVKYPLKLFDTLYSSCEIMKPRTKVLKKHLECAAYEFPMSPESDLEYFGSDAIRMCSESMEYEHGVYHLPREKQMCKSPALSFSLRCTSEAQLLLKIDGKIVEEIEISRAYYDLFESAVYFHAGKPHLITHISFETLEAHLQESTVKYLTMPDHSVKVTPIQTFGSFKCSSFGLVQVTSKLIQYYKYDPVKKKIIESVLVDGTPYERTCNALWISISNDLLTKFNNDEVKDIMNAFANATMKQILSLLGHISLSHVQEGNMLTIYSKHAHDEWIQSLFTEISNILVQTFNRVNLCSCESGCVHCIVQVYSHQQHQTSYRPEIKNQLREILRFLL